MNNVEKLSASELIQQLGKKQENNVEYFHSTYFQLKLKKRLSYLSL